MLNPRQTEILRALVNRIIPADDFPAGWEGGVGSYLARQFQGDLHQLLEVYARGLDSLDIEAQATYNTPFDQLTSDNSDALLTNVEIGKVVTAWLVEPALFFRLVVQHSAEGYYSDPGNGGNPDSISWQMIGFEVRG